MEYNSQGFTPEEVEKKLHLDLINYLLDFNTKSDRHYHDIHITTDGYCLIVEWTTNNYEDLSAGSFKFVDEDQVVMTEKIFPDNHTELCYNEADYKERLDEFLKENPGCCSSSSPSNVWWPGLLPGLPTSSPMPSSDEPRFLHSACPGAGTGGPGGRCHSKRHNRFLL